MGKQDILPGKSKQKDLVSSRKKANRFLILHNDDVHSFDYVIKSLIDVCKHDIIQAEQCTIIAHYKGKCDIMKGTYKQLKTFRNGLVEKGLKITIE